MEAQVINGASLTVAESQNHQATPVKTNTVKNPRRLKVNIENVDKDILEDIEKALERDFDHSVTVIDAETTNKVPLIHMNLQAKVSPKRTVELQEDSSSEPEIKKKRKGRNSSDKVTVLVKQRSSNRSTKGRLSKNRVTSDLFASAPISSPANITKRKTAAAGLIASTKPLPSTPPAHELKDKTDVNVPKPKETPATNGTASLLKRPSKVTPGTARKRVGGEGRTASLQRILLELPNLCDPNVFPDVLLKTYGSRLETSKVFECLATSDLKQAVMKKFSASELAAMIQASDSAAEKLLSVVSTEAILQEVLSREELRKSDKLLSVLLQNVGKISNETKKALNNENAIGTVLHVASDDAIVKEINARSSLKSSEKLINTLLQNLPEKISDETKKSVIKVLNEKFNTGELVDISHAAIKMSVDKYQKQ